MVSMLFGKLDANRQLTVAPDCAIAGAATVLAAIPAAAFFRNARRFMVASVANRCSCYERRLITDVTSAEDIQSPAIVMRSINIEPHCLEPRVTISLPIATTLRNMSLRLPAIVISCTAYAISPFSIQKPAAPRE